MAPALDLSGVRAKLDRTDEQAVFLDAQWRTFRDNANVYGVEFEEDTQSCRYVVRLRVFEPIPLRLSVIFIIHNLRSALDHLVCRLVEAYGGTVGRHHAFPIYAVEADFLNGVSSRGKQLGQLDGIPPGGNVWALIEDAQPYKSGNAPKDHPLYIVHDFSKGDKHRLLNAAFALPEPADLIDAIGYGDTRALCVEIRQLLARGTPLEDGAEIAAFRFDARSPQPDMEVEGQLPLGIAFGDGQGELSDLGTAHAHILNLAEACERAFPWAPRSASD